MTTRRTIAHTLTAAERSCLCGDTDPPAGLARVSAERPDFG
ncbi:hypothetical protein [Alteraurantiacibacter aestuarii]|nr:hypothetical protein [Alteraurantiacibacter aestuarii]